MIPKNHILDFHLQIPSYFPVGETEVILVFASASKKQRSLKKVHNLAGSLAKSKVFKDDPIKIQRRLRDEWQ